MRGLEDEPGSDRLATISICGRALPGTHDQSFLNHSVGSRCSVAASGPRLAALTRIRMSSGAAFAYSTNTSK